MSKPKESGWGYAKSMIRRYPNKVNENERRAVETAIEKTRAMKNGECRMMVVDLVLMKQSHTIAGAAMKAYCSERAAREYHWEFIKLVGKSFKCESLW